MRYFNEEPNSNEPNSVLARYEKDVGVHSQVSHDGCSILTVIQEPFYTPTFCECGKELCYSHGAEW